MRVLRSRWLLLILASGLITFFVLSNKRLLASSNVNSGVSNELSKVDLSHLITVTANESKDVSPIQLSLSTSINSVFNESAKNDLIQTTTIGVNEDKSITLEVNSFKEIFSGLILSKYDKAIDNEKCSNEYGDGLIRRWQHSRIDVCAGFKQSSISCYKRDIFDRERLLCTAEFAQIETQGPFYTFGTKDLKEETKFDFGKGSFKVDCELSMYNWVPKSYWDERTLGYFFDEGQISDKQDIKCTNFVNHTVFWMRRYDEKNAYHFMEDVEQVFEAFLVLRKDPFEAELVAYDGLRKGTSLFTLWPYIFGKGVRILRTNPFPDGTCFKKNIFNLHAGVSLFSNNHGVGVRKSCKSAILNTLRYYLLKKFELWENVSKAKVNFRIIFIQRKDYMGRNIHRVIPNYDQVVKDLRNLLTQNEKYSKFTLEVFSPEDYPTFKDQVEVVRNASIYLGVHGAALDYIMFMPRHVQMVEIFYGDRPPSNRHFYNICQWLGVKHWPTGHLGRQGKDVSSDKIWKELVKAMDNILVNI